MNIDLFISRFSSWIMEDRPFFFLIDYGLEKFHLLSLDKLVSENIYCEIGDFRNRSQYSKKVGNGLFKVDPVSIDFYDNSFNEVMAHIKAGNSYLVNLTFPSKVHTEWDLIDVYDFAHAPYKLFFKDQFVSFSPESFIMIEDNVISTYPMKGTAKINESLGDKPLMDNDKELWEHYTIVDLLRNDLSMVAREVKVDKFRYIDRINTGSETIIQTSTKISGKLPVRWKETAGDLLLNLLPAGSITGAPKKKTMEIISQAEVDKRGYYTGVFGIYDGKRIDSAVCIRYLERSGRSFIYRSGGGITSMSKMEDEYDELISKIYVPTI